jgi:hypothetical protein
MAVPAVNITIDQGADYEEYFTITNPDGSPIDLVGHTCEATLAKFPGSSTTTSFGVGIVTSAGQVIVSIANTVTSQLKPGRYYYDIFSISNSTSKRKKIIEGNALVQPST